MSLALLVALSGCPMRAAAPSPKTPEPSPADSIYFVMVDRFANGDPANDAVVDLEDPAAFHGGDLQGLIDRLDYLEALGVRTVWLSPVFEMRTEKFFGHGAFHGYWTYDLAQVEPRFGTAALLRKLSDELHGRGMRLLLDLVVNHVGPDAPLVKARPEWFHRRGPLENWNDPAQLVGHDVHGLPDLAQEQEDVYRWLLESTLHWVREVRPDGFRLDAVKHVPVAFWARFNDELRAAEPSLFLLGEMLGGDPAVLSKVGTQGKFDAMFDFPLAFALVDVFCKEAQPARLGAVLSSDRLYADPDSLVTLLDNHDLPRVLTQCGGDVEKVRQALLVQLTMRGTPSLLYGSEAGLLGAKEPENRGDMEFGKSPTLQQTIASVLELRKHHPALVRGTPLMLEAQDGFFAYARVTQTEAAVVGVNRRKEPVFLRLPDGRWEGVEARAPGISLAPSSVQLVLGKPLSEGGFAELHRRAQAQRAGTRLREVRIELAGAPLGPMGGVYLVGSSPEAGSWNPREGLGPLGPSGHLSVRLPVGSVLEFKFVARAEGGAASWESGANRVLFVKDGQGPLQVRATWTREGP